MKYFMLLISLLCFNSLKAQNSPIKSATTRYLASKNLNLHQKNHPFVIQEYDNEQYLSAILKIDAYFDLKNLEAFGVIIGTHINNFVTLKIPVHKTQEIINLCQGYPLEFDQAIAYQLHEAKVATNVDDVHNGVNLPQAFTGKDVIVGILDVGFDYTHPTLYSSDGSEYRVKRVWEQKNNNSPHPAGYAYGLELTDSLSIVAQQSDNINQSHGAHVAGIAAGSAHGNTDNQLRGVAYESDLVLVGITPDQSQWQQTGMADIIDGVNYIFEYATAQGKPCVANLSWGCSIGPHDGSSLFSQALNQLTGPGRIFTISAGNNGTNNLHLSQDFNSNPAPLKSFIEYNANLPEKATWIDVWGSESADFCLKLELSNVFTLQSETNSICIHTNQSIDTFLIGSDLDTLHISIMTSNTEVNGRPHAFIELTNHSNNLTRIEVLGISGEVDLWMGYILGSSGYYGSFKSYNQAGFKNGDALNTIGEMAYTSSAIAVAAYASKNAFTSVSGQNTNYATYVTTGDRCPFSSKGGITNGIYKPNITAPGMTIASSVNSFDLRYSVGGSNYANVVLETSFNGNNYAYGEMSGTSMSSPMVAGIVALALERHPNITPQELIQFMAQNTIKDNFTGAIPDTTLWGAGKIDALALLEDIHLNNIFENTNAMELKVFPNPSAGFIYFNSDQANFLDVFNLTGQKLSRENIRDYQINLSHLKPGIYILNVFNASEQLLKTIKWTKM